MFRKNKRNCGGLLFKLEVFSKKRSLKENKEELVFERVRKRMSNGLLNALLFQSLSHFMIHSI